MASGILKDWVGRQKDLTDIGEKKVKTDAEAFKTAFERQKAIADLAGSATDQVSWTRARNTAALLGADVSQVPEQFNPATAQQIAGMALTQLQRMEQHAKEQQQVEVHRHNQATETNAAGQLAVSQGQLGVARGNLGLRAKELEQQQNMPKGVVVQTDAGPVLADPRSGQTMPLRDQQGNALGPKQKDIPQAVVQGYTKNQSALQKIDDAIAQIKANPGALGGMNVLGDAIRQRTDPGGVPTRAVVSDIGSLKIHDRTGAAMSAAESLRLKPFIPNTTDTPETAAAKLEQLKREYLDQNQGIEGYYNSDMGFKPITSIKRPASTGATPTGNGHAKVASDADYAALPSGATFVGPDGKVRRKP
jgi:hypothetical protein